MLAKTRKADSKRFTGKIMPKGLSGIMLQTGTGNFIMDLEKVRAVIQDIAKVLETQRADDVQELLQTARKCANTLQRIFERAAQSSAESMLKKSQLMHDMVEKINVIGSDYHAYLADLQRSKDGLKKALESSRGRRKLEQHNSLLLIETTALVEISEDMLQQHDSNYQKLPTFDDQEERVEILDPEGMEMWTELFGPTTFMVDVNKVVKGLMNRLGIQLTTAERKILLQVLDNSNTGQISSLRWNEFLKGFGPMRLCLHNLQDVLAKPWFHSFLSRDDATKLLEVEPKGTFMVRFSSTKPGSFSLAHTMEMGRVNHVIIHTRENGFAIREDNAREKLFPSISHLIEAYSAILIQPYSQTFPRQLWWHGDISADEANALLKDKKPGTFLIRFSSQRGCFASSYVEKNGVIEKGLVIGSPHGYQLSGKLFSSMEEIVDSLIQWNIFTEPYKNTTNEVNDKMRFKIVSEIVSTERSYLASMERVLTYFVPEFKANRKLSPTDVKTIFGNIESIVAVHAPFLQSLERAIQYWDADDTAVGPHILALMPKLPSVYSVYVNNFSESLEVLDRLSSKKEFKDFLDQVLAGQPQDASRQSTVQSFLIMPVQRPPRYVLLLMDLLKHTSGAHSDYDALSDALAQSKAATDQINQAKGAVEDVNMVRQKQAQISGMEGTNLAELGRSFVMEGHLTPLENDKLANKKDYHCFLFSDVIVITKRKGKEYKYKDLIWLKDTQVVALPDTPNAANLFRVMGAQSEVTLSAETEADKTKWVEKCKDLVAKLSPQAIEDRNVSMRGQSFRSGSMRRA